MTEANMRVPLAERLRDTCDGGVSLPVAGKILTRLALTPIDEVCEEDAEAAVKSVLGLKAPTELGALTVTSEAGTAAGTTAITVEPLISYGNHYVYETGASVTPPAAGQDVSDMDPWDGASDITATNGQEILIVEADAENKALAAGQATVVANGGT